MEWWRLQHRFREFCKVGSKLRCGWLFMVILLRW
jgi:hypothetical protein